MKYSLNVIGAGRLSQALSQLFIGFDLVKLQAVYSQSLQSASDLVDKAGHGCAVDSLLKLPRASITLIATPDDVIEPVAIALAQNPFLGEGDIIFHCSGVLESEVLLPLRQRGCFIASVHPLRSFSETKSTIDIDSYRGTYCAIEGSQEACEQLEMLFKTIGFIPFFIERDRKALYHSGAVFASNYLVTLFSEAASCMKSAGVSSEMAKCIVLSLMQGSLNNLKQKEISEALTGPLQRGDISTLKAHLAALSAQTGYLYQCLAVATLPLTQHTSEKKQALEELFHLLMPQP